jgi:pimeloyl-ACP methyl ester carboxylesterase
MSNIYTWKDGEVLNAEKMNALEDRTYQPQYLKRPANGVVNFKVKVDTYIADNDSNTLQLQDLTPSQRATYIKEDMGILRLPTSYSHNGKPTRLVIACHGAGTFITSSTSVVNTYANFDDLFLGEGYAVMDVNGTPGAQDTSSNKDRHFGTPIALRSYLAAYLYCINNYNLYPEVFVFGLSMGGLASTLLSELGNVPVLAQGIFCPVLDLFKEVLGYSWGVHTAEYKKAAVTEKMKLNKGTKPTTWTTPGTDGAPMPDNERNFFIANKDAFIGWNSMWRNVVGLDFEQYMRLPESAKRTDINTTECQAEAALFTNAYKFREVPLKIWHAKDDGTVPWRYSKYFIDMCKKAGCLAELRDVPSGGHIFWNTMQNISVATKYGGNVSVPASHIEVLNWFRRFE